MTRVWNTCIIGLLAFGIMCAFATLLFASPAVCGPRANILTVLSERYGEAVSGIGIANGGGAIVEITRSESGTWTIIRTVPSGVSCVLSAGHSWEQKPDGKRENPGEGI